MRTSATINGLGSLAASSLLARYIFALGLALGLSVLLGYWIGTGTLRMIIILPTVLLITLVVVGLQRKAWLLVVLLWPLAGQILLLPGSFSVRDTAVLLALLAWVAHHAFTHVKSTVRLQLLDWVVLANYAWLGVSFYLHPVGFRSTGSATVGGRFYWDAMIALLAYWILLRLPENPRQILRIPILWAVGTFIPTVFSLIAFLSPQWTPLLYNLYSGVATEYYLMSGQEVNRFGDLGAPGVIVATYLCARYAPISLLNPLRPRFYLLALSFLCILLSGFRNYVIWFSAVLLIGAWLRGGWWDAFRVGALGTLFVVILVAGQGSLYRLPYPMQRAMTFLPGRWDQAVIEDARGSSEARFQWWRDVFRYRMINDWWFGDGFAVGRKDFDLLLSGSGAERMLALGSYHNGPLTAIRKVGIVGLALFYVLFIAAAREAVKCVHACRETSLFPLAAFIAIPLLWWSVHYTFVFGAYGYNFVDVVFTTGLLRLVIQTRAAWGENPDKAGATA